MDYETACESNVSRRQARAEIELHSASWADFVAEYGDHEEYCGANVLEWLGY